MAKKSTAKKSTTNAKRTAQPFKDEEAETESTSSTSTRLLPAQDQNPRNTQSMLTTPSAPLPPQPSLKSSARALLTSLENAGYDLTNLDDTIKRIRKSLPSRPLSAVASLSNLGRQPRTKLYHFRCIFKDNNGQCETRGRGPPGKVKKFLCEKHTVQEEREDDSDDEDEEIDHGEDDGDDGDNEDKEIDHSEDGDDGDDEDEEIDHGEDDGDDGDNEDKEIDHGEDGDDGDNEDEEIDYGEDGGDDGDDEDEEIDHGEDGGTEEETLKKDEDEARNYTKLLRSGRRI